MNLRARLTSGIAIAVLLLIAGSALAQGTLGRLAGTVLDTSGGVMPGATVKIVNTQTNQSQTAITNEIGAFRFAQLPVGTYQVTIELTGFKTASYPNVQINVNQEYSLTARLEVGGATETIEVIAGSPLVRTTTPEVSKTIDQKQVLQLPIVNRDMTQLIRVMAGVPGIATRMNTSINGGRATWTQVTVDGINVQDNFIRTNSLDFLPNRPTSDNVAEFTITSSVQGAEAAGGASAVRMVTPSGTNKFGGSAWWQNRDNSLAANSFFNNKSGVPRAELKQNQFGGRVGGPIVKDKVFFWASYDGFRREQAGAQNVTIAARPDLFQGVWRYVRSDGQVGSINILQAVGATADPRLQTDLFSKIPASSNVNNYDRGDSSATRILNTAGYRWDQQRLTQRNYITGRLDIEASAQHHFELVGAYFKETDDRPDLDFISGPGERPKAFTESPVKRFAAAWRWQPSASLQNELRGGANLAPVKFQVVEGANPTTYRFAGQTATLPLTLQDPEINFFPQGRNTNTYQLMDSATLSWRDHAFQMGANWQRIHVNPYNYEATVPTLGWGFSSAAPASAQLNSAMFPGGISAADLASANTMLAMLTGTVSQVSRTFQVENQTSGYVPGIPNNRNYTLDNISAYIQDHWRLKPNLTVRAGLKWEYYSPVSEDDNLGFLPVANGQGYEQVLRDPNATITFVNGGLWQPDRNNFGPTLGFAWDVFKNGKTAVTGGYSLTFVNEEGVTVATNSLGANAGLATATVLSSLYANYSAGIPTIPTPTFKSVRTLPDQMALSATAPMGMPDPNLQQPKVHQVSVGVAHELPWSFAGEVRYVGSFGRGIWKGIDMNQVQYSQAFLDDFNRARSNGFLAQQAGLAFSPVYNPAVPGSVPLTVLPNYGLLTNSSVRTFIQQNEVGGLADFYVTQRVPGALATFYQNPGIYEARAVTNDGWQDYNALQFELRRQYRGGVFGAVNYTLSRTRSNSAGGATQSRFEPYLDNARPELDAGRSPNNITHIVNANFIVDLPWGEGRRWLNKGGVTNAIVGGWQLSGIVNWQSGSPVGINATRGTFNRANRSGLNTAVTSLSQDEIRNLFGVFKTPNGNIYWINPSVIGPDGRAVGPDTLNNVKGFDGQVFFNPTANAVGSLPIYAFNAPSVWQINAALSKRFNLVGRTNMEFRIEAFNLTNSVSFYTGDFNINSTTFGRLTQTGVGARVVQLTARLNF